MGEIGAGALLMARRLVELLSDTAPPQRARMGEGGAAGPVRSRAFSGQT